MSFDRTEYFANQYFRYLNDYLMLKEIITSKDLSPEVYKNYFIDSHQECVTDYKNESDACFKSNIDNKKEKVISESYSFIKGYIWMLGQQIDCALPVLLNSNPEIKETFDTILAYKDKEEIPIKEIINNLYIIKKKMERWYFIEKARIN